jgi:hypothetical protein
MTESSSHDLSVSYTVRGATSVPEEGQNVKGFIRNASVIKWNRASRRHCG